MWALIITMFFSGSSVALPLRSVAAYMNPAGLYFKPGVEFLFGAYQDSTYRFSLSLQSIGLAIKGDNNGVSDYVISEGFGFKNTALGMFYAKGSRYGMSFMTRPAPFLSLGGVFDNKKNYRVGSALNLFSGRLFLSMDYVFRDTSLILGAGGRPLDWLFVSLKTSKHSLSLGFDVFFGHSAVSLTLDTLKSGVELMVSSLNYPSFIKPHHRWVKVVPHSYREYRTKSGFLFPFMQKNSFYDFLYRIRELVNDPNVEGLYLDLRFSGLSMYQKEEFLDLLKIAKKSGKKIVIFSDMYGMSDLPLMAIADKVILVPEGELITPGFASTGMFFKDMLSKLGVKVEAPKIGRYKSAVEPFTRENYSDPAREQVEVLLQDFFDYIASESEPRYKLSQMIDTAFFNSDDALKKGYVDTVIHVEKVKDYIKDKFDKKVKIVDFAKYNKDKPYDFTFGSKRGNIALLVLDGDIIRGECSQSALPIPVLGGRHIGSFSVIRILEHLKNDKRIKGVVIRVNSPGGDALASEEMYSAVKSLAEKKPVVISMASVAASGGYYISAPATYIMADKTTVTGSIGILNLKFVISDMLSKIGISTETVKIGEHADVFSPYRESTEEEKAVMQKELKWGYNMFLDRVSRGRGLTKDSVNVIGEGRVWSGTRGREIGLVDSIGGLLNAIEKCASLAKVKKPEVRYVSCMRAKGFGLLGNVREPFRIPPSGRYYISPILEVK